MIIIDKDIQRETERAMLGGGELQRAIKEDRCSKCGGPIKPGEYYYFVWAVDRLGYLRFPGPLHVDCIVHLEKQDEPLCEGQCLPCIVFPRAKPRLGKELKNEIYD